MPLLTLHYTTLHFIAKFLLANIVVQPIFRGDTGGPVVDQERRIRREIANSNERRRMQSINAGFQSLRTLLPHHEGEKLSKVSRRPECVENRCDLHVEVILGRLSTTISCQMSMSCHLKLV